MNSSRGGKLIDKKFLGNMLLVSGIVVSFMLFCGFVGVTELLNNDVFAKGVFIDGINVSGLNLDEGRQAVEENAAQQLSQIHVTLNYNGNTRQLDAGELGISFNTEEMVTQAYNYNKLQSDTVEQRFDKTSYLSGGVNFESERIIDQARLRATVDDFASQFIAPAVDASASFDKVSSIFAYTEEQSGTEVDADQLFNDILSAIGQQDSTSLQVVSKEVPPVVTADDLERNTVLISSFETTAEFNANRNMNISLIASAVDGLEIKPGETLSLNETTGQRTEEKGYKPASAISDGILVDQVGGGICQLAGTLYNAALLTDLEIVERVNHTWPSVYLPVGQDSTLNWNDKDLKIRNNSDHSVYISAKFKDQKLTVSLYGQPLPDGKSIKVENKIIKEIKPGATEVLYSNKLPIGTTQTVRKARTGYQVEVYRVYYQDGVEVERELVSKDSYPALNKIVLKGRDVSQDK